MIAPLTHDDPYALGGHRLVARLGSGGMGTVYLARSATGRTAALKTMHAHIAADPAVRARFRLEADAARVIGPVHGARVFDADPLAEVPWLATEYVLGPPLDEAVRLAGPLPERAVRALGALLCAALGQLHASDVVHRDLKPSNVMVTADGPKVIDFGIARALGDDRLTRTGTAAGTPAFMSPEQATGQEHTPAGDIFALAGVLVFAATGHGPFGSGGHADLMYRVRHADPDLIGVPPGLRPVLARCLDKDPAGRPATGDLAALLHPGPGGFADHLPEPLLAEITRRAGAVWSIPPRRLPAPPEHGVPATVPSDSPRPHAPTAGTKGSGPSRRRLLTLGAAAGLAAAGAGAGVWARFGRPDTTAAQPPAAAPTGGPARDLLWQEPVSYADPLIPPAPLLLDGLLLVGEYGVKGLDPATGAAKWADPSVYFMRRTTTDGTKIYSADHALDENEPLRIAAVDTATGKLQAPFGTLKDLQAILYGTQLLCAAPDAVYLVGGRGPHLRDGFLKDQKWFLLKVDSRSGGKLWEVPLPARPDRSPHLHFLSARAVGGHLVLVQQSADREPRLVVHDALTGRALWDRPLQSPQPVLNRAHLAVDDRHVYPSAGELIALDLADGRPAWRFAGRTPTARFGPPAVKDGVVYAVEENRGLVALDAANGTPRWTEGPRTVAAEDLGVPPAVGISTVYAYSGASAALVAADLRTGAPSRPVGAARARFFADPAARRLIAVGDAYVAAYPLA
ncbi:protein kinase domain-containing protein [Streptomyces sp. NRRL F-2664]|uniref:protein kinase domain-containing protein n=1 Tax=Streptomyces sp. NRRL F-2664 TaxID=1463842 RepID=UPI0004CAAD4F|nr:PQQ-binding-like beta-propeller repeat protein [Streptomyces sp. NRRL F-2664]